MDGWIDLIFCIVLHALFNNDLLAQILCSGVGWSGCASGGQAVGCHILFIGFPDDPKGLYISVGNVCDGVSIERWLMGNRADLLDRNSRR